MRVSVETKIRLSVNMDELSALLSLSRALILGNENIRQEDLDLVKKMNVDLEGIYNYASKGYEPYLKGIEFGEKEE